MAYDGVVFAGSLLDINIAAAGSLTVLAPLLSGIDLSLFGPLGIGAIQANLQAQLNATLSASVSINLGLLNPLAGFESALASILQLEASILSALSLGAIPAISVEVTTQLSAMAAFAASLDLQIGGLLALIQALLNAKIPAVSFAGSLAASLSAGDAFLISFENVPMATVGANIAGSFSTTLTPPGGAPPFILPTDPVYGIVIVTKLPSTWTAIQAILRT